MPDDVESKREDRMMAVLWGIGVAAAAGLAVCVIASIVEAVR